MAVTITELEWEPNMNSNTFKAAYLDGYRSVRNFSVELEKYLPIFIAARIAESATWIFFWTEAEKHKYRDDLIKDVAYTTNRLEQFLSENFGV